MLGPSSLPELNDSAGLPESLTLPLALTGSLRLNPEEFAEVCAANPDAVLELAPDGALIPMTPTGSEASGRNGALVVALGQAVQASGLPENCLTARVASACQTILSSAPTPLW
ncbi:MAG: Uma2 family endonuclease [Cyanobacteriota bacterium]|nr:Uma2 family endonuclease [Cyanobacteriota bacterium]